MFQHFAAAYEQQLQLQAQFVDYMKSKDTPTPPRDQGEGKDNLQVIQRPWFHGFQRDY